MTLRSDTGSGENIFFEMVKYLIKNSGNPKISHNTPLVYNERTVKRTIVIENKLFLFSSFRWIVVRVTEESVQF